MLNHQHPRFSIMYPVVEGKPTGVKVTFDDLQRFTSGIPDKLSPGLQALVHFKICDAAIREDITARTGVTYFGTALNSLRGRLIRYVIFDMFRRCLVPITEIRDKRDSTNWDAQADFTGRNGHAVFVKTSIRERGQGSDRNAGILKILNRGSDATLLWTQEHDDDTFDKVEKRSVELASKYPSGMKVISLREEQRVQKRIIEMGGKVSNPTPKVDPLANSIWDGGVRSKYFMDPLF
jgi:hypothetical protein